MNKEERNKKYLAYVSAKSPKTEVWPSLFWAFIIGGLICCFGQLVSDTLSNWFPYMTETELGAWTLVVIIFITCLLTGIGLFDDIARFAGAGTIVPITGFANSICSSAMEFRREGIIFSSIIIGVVYLFL